MRCFFLLSVLCFLNLPATAADLLLTHTHGRNGGSADTRILIQDAPNDLENFSFVIAFAQDTLAFDRILETPHTGWGWKVTSLALSPENGKERIRISFSKDLAEKALPGDRDYLLCDLRFSVKQNKTTVLYLEEPEGDMKAWHTENARFFHTDQTSSGDDTDSTAHISCFLNTLAYP